MHAVLYVLVNPDSLNVAMFESILNSGRVASYPEYCVIPGTIYCLYER